MNAAALLVLRTMARIEGFKMPTWKELLDDMSLMYYQYCQGCDPETWDEVYSFIKRGGSIFEAILAYQRKYEWLSIFSVNWRDAKLCLEQGRPLGLHFHTQRWDLIGGAAADDKGGHAVLVTAITDNSITIQNSWGLMSEENDIVSKNDLHNHFYNIELFDVGFLEEKLGFLWRPQCIVSQEAVLERFLVSIRNGPDHSLSKMFPVLVDVETYCNRTNFCQIFENLDSSSKTSEEKRLSKRRKHEMLQQAKQARRRQEMPENFAIGAIGWLLVGALLLLALRK